MDNDKFIQLCKDTIVDYFNINNDPFENRVDEITKDDVY